jgi:uncharacterized protein
MKQLTFLELALKVLEEEKRPLTAIDIWEIAKTKGYDEYVGSEGKTPWYSIEAQMYVNIRDKKDSPFIRVSKGPRRFYLRTLVKEGEDVTALITETEANIALPSKKFNYLEKDLHPFLAYFGYFYLRAHLKTIFHNKSGKKEFSEWLHPDMVGCYFPINEWEPEVFDFSSTIGELAIKIYSFELKRELNFSNLRESFFQAVSNSSWANEGYLAASEINNNEEFRNELKRLSTSFGIGVIKIDIVDPDSTEIIFPAKPRENLDWEAINKLAINPDFKEFLKRVKNDISIKEISREKYDNICEKDDLIRSIKTS